MSLKAKIVLIFTLVAVAGGGFIAYSIYQARVSKGLEIQITGPEKVLIGAPFEAKVNVINSSDNILEQVRLSINLPDGLALVGSPATKNNDYHDIGTLQPGEISLQTLRLIALNGQNTFKKFSVSGTYLSGSLSSRFEKSADFQFQVGDFGIALDIATPQQIFSGESFDTKITYKNASPADFDNLKLVLEYPPTFSLTRSTLKPDIGNNTWLLGGLHPNSDNNFTVTGNIIGSDGASFDIKANVVATLSGQDYPITVNTATLAIASSPLSVKVSLNNNPDFVAHAGDTLNYTLSFTNNTDIGLRDVIIKAQLIGEMFDFAQLSSGGTFSSNNNTITWNASNLRDLSVLAPGQSGSVNFTIHARSNYPIRRISDKNYTLKVRATIESPTVPNFVQATKTFSLSTLDTKVGGQLKIDTKGYFRDASSGIINKGPFPPKVNQPTQYTIHWQLTNYSTDVRDITVTAFLGGNAKFTGLAKASGGSSLPTYDDRTQQMTWTVSRIPATVGVISSPLEATFQITATPSSSDAFTFMPLIQVTSVKATDDFTGESLSGNAEAVSTQLPDDSTVAGTSGAVQK